MQPDLPPNLLRGNIHKSGTCAQTESKPDPCGTVKDQIDSNKEPDHPESGGRPLRKNKEAQDNGYDSVHCLPTPARQRNPY